MGESGFRIVFLLTKIIVAYVAATNIISPESRYEITLFLTLVVTRLWVSNVWVKIEEDIK
jgi:hypothetical protein